MSSHGIRIATGNRPCWRSLAAPAHGRTGSEGEEVVEGDFGLDVVPMCVVGEAVGGDQGHVDRLAAAQHFRKRLDAVRFQEKTSTSSAKVVLIKQLWLANLHLHWWTLSILCVLCV